MFDAASLKEFGRQTGLELRVCDTRPFLPEIRWTDRQAREGLFINPESWTPAEVRRFYSLREHLPAPRSIVAAALNYLTPEEPDPSRPGLPYGLVARYTRRNYYLELRRRLRTVARFIQKGIGGKTAVYANGPVPEKPMARRSGIGYYGKHSIIINPRFGSWCVLGEILSDKAIKPDPPLDETCGACRRCLDACPTRAIIRPYVIDRRLCIQALTNWLGEIPDRIRRVWGKRVYGCTDCQDACPVNAEKKPGPAETEIGIVGQWLPIKDILTMSEEEYRARYSNNQLSAGWINFSAIRRNCLIALGNIQDPATLPAVERFTSNPDPMLAASARWAKKMIRDG